MRYRIDRILDWQNSRGLSCCYYDINTYPDSYEKWRLEDLRDISVYHSLYMYIISSCFTKLRNYWQLPHAHVLVNVRISRSTVMLMLAIFVFIFLQVNIGKGLSCHGLSLNVYNFACKLSWLLILFAKNYFLSRLTNGKINK